MKKPGKWFAANWVALLYFVLATAAVLFLLWFKLGSLTPGLSQAEKSQSLAGTGISGIIENPIGLPYKVLRYAAQKMIPGNVGLRAAGTVIGLLTAGCFYYVLRYWYTKRVAFFGFFTFLTSAWFLSTARSGTDASMYMLLFAAVACFVWLRKSDGSVASIIAAVVLSIGLLYTPGMIWFIVPLLLWQTPALIRMLKQKKSTALVLVVVITLIVLIPLGQALYRDKSLILTYLGLPQQLPTPQQYLHDVASVPVRLFFRGPDAPDLWLGRLPLLNIFSAVMCVLGVYGYYRKRKLDRTPIILFVLIAGLLIIAFNGSVNISLILPFVFLVVAEGISFLLIQWNTVFPRNPFGRVIGASLLTTVVLLAGAQGVRQYFVAWPNTPATKQAHKQQLN